jgi:hypothetical protein
MPHFLQTAFLSGLAALAIPILIHLIFRLKTKRVELGTIRFLRTVLEENARRRKVMRWLLLALRMSFVALLVGLFARPYFTTAATGGDKELLVILIDQSATMQLKGEHGRLVDQAVDEAKKLIQSASSGTRFELAFFDHNVRPLTATSDHGTVSNQEIVERLKAPTAAFRATNYGAAIAWARDIFMKAVPGRKQLHLFTDLQRSGLDWTEVEPFPVEVKSHLHDLGNPVVNNVSISEVRTPRLWVRPGEAPSIKASIQHGGAFPLSEVPIILEIGRVEQGKTSRAKLVPNSTSAAIDFSKLAGRITKRERVKLEPGATVTLDFDLPPLEEGLWQGRIVVEYDDDLAFDNQRYFAISATPAYQVLVLNGGENGSSVTSETYFVEMALRLAGVGESFSESPFHPTVVAFNDANSVPNLSSFDAVLLANVVNVKRDDARKLASFVAGGGGLLVFTGDKVSAGSVQSLTDAGLSVGVIGEPKTTVDLPWRLRRWNAAHPVFQPLSDPQHGDLRRLIFAAYTQVAPSADTDVLMEFSTGDPAIMERRIGEGTAIWVAISCGRDWSDWSRSRLFLPLLHQLLGYEVGLTQGGRVRNRLVDTERKDDPGSTHVADAGEGKSASEDTGVLAAESLTSPGLYSFNRYVEVVNTSPRESDDERCSRQEFEDRFAMKFEDDDGSVRREKAAAGQVEFQQDEIWHWVACALLVVLLFEGFVGNRTTA